MTTYFSGTYTLQPGNNSVPLSAAPADAASLYAGGYTATTGPGGAQYNALPGSLKVAQVTVPQGGQAVATLFYSGTSSVGAQLGVYGK